MDGRSHSEMWSTESQKSGRYVCTIDEGIPDKQCSGRITARRRCHARGASTTTKTGVSRVLQ